MVALIALAVVFDFINGFHDTANAVATVIATRVLRPWMAIYDGGRAELRGSDERNRGRSDGGERDRRRLRSARAPITAALVGAIAWNLFTWYFGIPSSSSHALIGSLLGVGIASLGIGSVSWAVLVHKVALPLVLSPAVGFVFALLLMRLLIRVFGVDEPLPGRPDLPTIADHFRGVHGVQPRQQRRSEDHGNHHPGAWSAPESCRYFTCPPG